MSNVRFLEDRVAASGRPPAAGVSDAASPLVHPIEPLASKLSRLGALSHDDQLLLEEIPLTVRKLESRRDLVREGDQPANCHLLLDGFVCRFKMLHDGSRQITSFHMKGDICDLPGLLLGNTDHSVSTLTRVSVAAMPHAILLELIRRSTTLGRLLWLNTMADAAISCEWVANVGRRSAYRRIAHLLCELVTRMRAAGLAQQYRCELPVTQGDIADATGLSTVHVNRVIQELRAEGMIELQRGCFTALDWESLKSAAGFDPAYLHQIAAWS